MTNSQAEVTPVRRGLWRNHLGTVISVFGKAIDMGYAAMGDIWVGTYDRAGASPVSVLLTAEGLALAHYQFMSAFEGE